MLRGEIRRLWGSTPAILALIWLLASCSSGGDPVVVIGPMEPRQGEVVRYRFSTGVEPQWAVEPPEAGLILADGRFVGYQPGPAVIVARTPGADVPRRITILPREAPQGEFTVQVRGAQIERFTSDLWLAGSFGYTGTWLGSTVAGRLAGDRLFVWDLADPLAPRLAMELPVDARTVNTVNIRADSMLAALTHEGSSDGLNGVTLLNLADPLQPAVIARFTEGLESGVHNVWLEEDFLYAVADGVGKGLRIIDIRRTAWGA